MTREELEKMFDERFNELYLHKYAEGYEPYGSFECKDEVKQFIFDTIIPEVLKSVIPPVERYAVEGTYLGGINDAIEYSERKVKELYGIDL